MREGIIMRTGALSVNMYTKYSTVNYGQTKTRRCLTRKDYKKYNVNVSHYPTVQHPRYSAKKGRSPHGRVLPRYVVNTEGGGAVSVASVSGGLSAEEIAVLLLTT